MNGKKLIPPGLVYLADNIIAKQNILGTAKKEGARWAKDLNLPPKAETVSGEFGGSFDSSPVGPRSG